jgi:hypothetical protein
MKNTGKQPPNESLVKKGYNEKNPSAPEGAFPPASAAEQPSGHGKNAMKKANAADKSSSPPEKKADLKKNN